MCIYIYIYIYIHIYIYIYIYIQPCVYICNLCVSVIMDTVFLMRILYHFTGIGRGVEQGGGFETATNT